MTTNIYEQIELSLRKMQIPYRCKEALAKHTTFRVGGNCRIMMFPQNSKQVMACLLLIKGASKIAKQEIPCFVLGNGSNVLAADKGFDGVVLALGSNYAQVTRISDNQLLATAGAHLNTVCLAAQQHGLAGLEFAYGIPGTVGGAVCMNAGAYGGEMKDVVTSCTFIGEQDTVGKFDGEALSFTYRHSAFSDTKKVILGAVFTLQPGDSSEIKTKMFDFLSRRKEKQPLEYPSAGSTFKRPVGHFAGQLIEEAGLKGASVGGAQVSEKHAGFIINHNHATAKDIKALIQKVQDTVQETAGIVLEREVQFLG